MQQSVPSRKRPAPGASPLVQQPMNTNTAYQYQQQQQQPHQSQSQISDFNNFDLSTSFDPSQSYSDPSFDTNNYATSFPAPQPQTYGTNLAPAPSTDLVRRARPQSGIWNGDSKSGTMNGNADEEDEQDLDAKAALAKKDAQGKRKQIPPFVQKLSSFLDSNNTELIRWSDDGRAFIVLDEDEFARTLIPELFKHNNYASFVRQLNMYGFHKTVNITDGSLRQSEKARKGVKPPSMYSHPYFRKNRPDLLWLIQKPNTKGNAKRKRDDNVKAEGFDSDDERQYSPGPDGRLQGEIGAPSNQGLAPIPRNELANVRQELKKLQQQQHLISRMIAQLKEQNEQFYRQATAFQALHDRHENSINAILTFLATFYNRSLEGQNGPNLVNMFGSQGQTGQQQHGSVVEEYNDGGSEANNQQMQRFNKRQPLLLGAPNTSSPYNLMSGAVTEPSSARQSASPPAASSSQTQRDSTGNVPPQRAASINNRTTASPRIKDDASTPNLLDSVPENDQMLSMINSINATNASNESTPAFDMSNVPEYQNPGSLTTQQRNNMIAMINQHGGGKSGDNKALMSPTPPPYQQHMENIRQNQKQIDELTDLQKLQDDQIDGLESKIAGYSPGTQAEGNPFDYDLTNDDFNYFGDGANPYFDFASAANATNPNFALDNFSAPGEAGDDMFPGVDENGGSGVDESLLAAPSGTAEVESLSSQGNSPAVDQENEATAEQDRGSSNKKRRTN